jgi:deoxyribodipyrimidine photolyase
MERLAAFTAQGLPQYADERNDPNIPATSRLSPYLHFGNLSINEVLLSVRDAAPAAQYEKFQDEALTWRELAHNEALRVLEHLNNKYALDGRDPNSYGGILWCFGKFDRPF